MVATPRPPTEAEAFRPVMGHQTKTKQIGNPAGVDNAVVIFAVVFQGLPAAAVQRPINWIVIFFFQLSTLPPPSPPFIACS